MAAYAAVVSLMNNMEQIMNHPSLSNCFDNQQIQSLLRKAGSLLELIEGYGRGGLFSKEAEALERQITSAAYATEDVIEIWKMRQLRHVKIDRVYLPHPRNRQDCMENLQTLTKALNLRLSEEVCQIIPNIKKLGLVYDPGLYGHDYALTECLRNLDRLHKLESLNITIKLCPDWKLSSKLAFPLSLKKLRLVNCRLCWEDLSMIGSLPQLQVLHLNCDSHISMGDRWSPISGQFLRLKYLKIENCSLRSWDADSSHFPALEKLVLRYLHNLEGIPLEIGEIPTLELIRVEYCEDPIAISALKIKKDQLENYDNDALQIEVMVYDEEDAEEFKKSMEAEELAFDLHTCVRRRHRAAGPKH